MRLHESVLLEETLYWLNPKAGGIYVDGTIGAGGHAERILEKSGPSGQLVGFDKDLTAIAEAGKALEAYGKRVRLFHEDFKEMSARLVEERIEKVDGIFLDLGVSSMQLDRAARGFSFKNDGPLDMRMNVTESLTAMHLVNRLPEKELADLIWKFGEERYSRRIAAMIVRSREKRRIETTGDLASLIYQAVPSGYRHGRIHPATRTFQALRLAVNDELGSLGSFLSGMTDILNEGARVVILTFHSLEDRIVKHAFREMARMKQGKVLTKKPLEPTEAEMQANPRSRSAKLRAFEKSSGDADD